MKKIKETEEIQDRQQDVAAKAACTCSGWPIRLSLTTTSGAMTLEGSDAERLLERSYTLRELLMVSNLVVPGFDLLLRAVIGNEIGVDYRDLKSWEIRVALTCVCKNCATKRGLGDCPASNASLKEVLA